MNTKDGFRPPLMQCCIIGDFGLSNKGPALTMDTPGPSTDVHFIVTICTVLTLTAFCPTSALNYASNISVSADLTSATLTWTAASSGSANSYLLVLLLDGGMINVSNYTISDPNTETYTLTDLVFSTYYTVKLYTVSNDDTDRTEGTPTVSFWTKYAIWNKKFIAALGVIGFIFLTLLVMMGLKSAFLEEKKNQDENPVLEDEEEGGIEKGKQAWRNSGNIAVF